VAVAQATVEVRNRLGLHLRAASTLAQTAAKFSSSITLARGKDRVSARSVTGVMMLGAGIGSRIKVEADGPDSEKALKAIEDLFHNKFGEE
jgi:phosphocarrier protein HPr